MNLTRIAGIIECIGGALTIVAGVAVGLLAGWSVLGMFATVGLKFLGVCIFTDGFFRAKDNENKKHPSPITREKKLLVPEEAEEKGNKSKNMSNNKFTLENKNSNKPTSGNVDFAFTTKNKPTFFGNAHDLPQQSFSNMLDKRASYSP